MSKKDKAGAASKKKRIRVALTYAGIGLLTTILLVGLKLAIERSSYGHDAELWVFGKLQGSLSAIDPDNPIVLLDISDLPGGREGQPTPRDKLKEIIEALADQHPLAIAVDVDFSPKPNSFATEDDPDFFDFCLDIRNNKKIPVFLAVGKRKSAPPEAWLGQEEYKDLAVAVAADKQDTSRIPLWVRAKGASDELKTMSYALALEYRKHMPEASSWIKWAVDPYENRHEEEAQSDDSSLTYADGLVNYSKLDAMKIAAKKNTSAESVRETGSEYYQKLVIIGDVSKPMDFFPVPGRRLNEGGSLLHASATYTLIKEPLFEFKPWARLLLDFLIAGFIITMVAVIRYRNPDDSSWIGKQALFIYGAIAVVIFFGWLLVRTSGVMWLDFLFVAFALFLHPKLDHLIHKIGGKLKRKEKHDESPPDTGGAGVEATIIVIAVSLMWTSTIHAQQTANPCEKHVAAVVLSIKSEKGSKKGKKRNCYCREKKDAPWQELSAADIGKKKCHAGQDIYCDEGTTLLIRLCGTGEEYLVTAHPPKRYRVLNAYSSPRWIDRYQDIPARMSRLFRPDNPNTPYLMPLEERAAFDMGSAKLIGRISGVTPTSAGPPTPSTATSEASASTAVSNSASTSASIGSDRAASRTASERAAAANVTRDTASSAAASPDEERQKELEKEREVVSKFAGMLEQGNSARNDNKFAEAEQAYKDALALVPTDSRVYYALGNVYSDQGKWDEAEQAYMRALSINPYLSQIQLALAYVLVQPRKGAVNSDKLAQAEALWWNAASLELNDERAYDLLDAILEKRGASVAEVERAYLRAVALNPYSVNASLRLSQLLRKDGRKSEADKYLRKAEELATRPQELLSVAQVMESQQRYDRADRLLRRILSLNQRDPRALYMLGRVLLFKKHYAEAIEFLKSAAGTMPDNFIPRYLLGLAEMSAGKLIEAERTFDEIAAKAPTEGEELLAVAYSFSSLGDTYAATKHLTDAVRLYEKSLKYDPEDEETKDKLLETRAHLER
jgi:tetratricopeptide (TPR) repeat protein